MTSGWNFDNISSQKRRLGPPQDGSERGTPLEQIALGDSDTKGTVLQEVDTPGAYEFAPGNNDDTLLSRIELDIQNTTTSSASETLTFTLSSVYGPVTTQIYQRTHDLTLDGKTSAKVALSGDGRDLRADGEYVSGFYPLPVSTIRVESVFSGSSISIDSLIVYLKDTGWVENWSPGGKYRFTGPNEVSRIEARPNEDGIRLPSGVFDQTGQFHNALVSGTGNGNRDGNGLDIDPTTQAPSNPSNGQVEYADGVGWDPGADGVAGFYGYEEGSWVKL